MKKAHAHDLDQPYHFQVFFQFLLKYRKNKTNGKLIPYLTLTQGPASGAAGSSHRTIVCMERVISLLSRPIAAQCSWRTWSRCRNSADGGPG
jgi:hypothetical protein